MLSLNCLSKKVLKLIFHPMLWHIVLRAKYVIMQYNAFQRCKFVSFFKAEYKEHRALTNTDNTNCKNIWMSENMYRKLSQID